MKKLIIFFLLLFLTLPSLLPFFNPKFFYTQDYIFIARLQQMSTALSQGQFPVRWAPDLRYGEPLFNFYAPLPYYIGALIHYLGFNFIWTAKILFILSSIFSAFTMYLLANKLFGAKGGVLAAVLYVWAPYRALDLYVRGALSEAWAFVFFPLIFYTSLSLSEKFSLKNVTFLSLSLAGLFLTHNVSIVLFLPFLLAWWVYLVLRQKSLRKFFYFFPAAILGFGLSAFYLLPAFLESSFIQTKYLTVGYFNFRAHFVAVKQFFSLFWGYGSSVWGPEDGLSFQIGLLNLAVVVLTSVLVFINRKNKKLFLLFIFLFVSFLFSIFLQHNKSAFVWETFKEMAFIQFPWRFLGITVFIVSVMGGLLSVYIKGKAKLIILVLIVATLVFNFNYFKPKEYANDSFFDKFLNTDSLKSGVDLTKDYLPVWVQTTDKERLEIPRAKQGDIIVSNFEKKTNLNFDVSLATDSTVEVPVTYFPGWQVKVNNKITPLESQNEEGLIVFRLPEGAHKVEIKFTDTPIRTFSNIVSVVSAGLVLGIFFLRKKFHND